MVSYEADLPISQWVRAHYPALAQVLAATFDFQEQVLVRLLESASHSVRLASLKGVIDKKLFPHALAAKIGCSCGDSPSQEATRLLFSVYKPEMEAKAKPALTIGVDESGVFIDLQGLLLHAGDDTRCRVDLEAIAIQLARTPAVQPLIAAALTALPVKAKTRAETYKAAALSALEAATKVAPRLRQEGASMMGARYEAVLTVLMTAFGLKQVPPGLKQVVDNVMLRGKESETVTASPTRSFTLRATDPSLPTGQISLEITCSSEQKVVLVMTPQGCGIDFGYLRLSTEHGNRWDVAAFVQQTARQPTFAVGIVTMLEAFSRLVQETPEMRRLRYDVLRQLRAPAKAVSCEA